ncbi:hypothetical protein [Nocardia brasiliensis]|uniref:hypothetical protein n=1 Tax=Nocardia brasiliensis TaxID=37326 RepID=UPI00245608C9|nr:hypothetical protein [Nocardia brasiliensis]
MTTTDPHARALELRQRLYDAHTADNTPRITHDEEGNPCYADDFDGVDFSAEIAEAEQALEAHLVTHRDVLSRMDFWRGEYADLDARQALEAARPEPTDK